MKLRRTSKPDCSLWEKCGSDPPESSSWMLIGSPPQQRVLVSDAVAFIPSTGELWLVWVSDYQAQVWITPSHLSLPIQDNHARLKWDNSFCQVKAGRAREPRCLQYTLHSQMWCRQIAAEKCVWGGGETYSPLMPVPAECSSSFIGKSPHPECLLIAPKKCCYSLSPAGSAATD